MFRVLIAGGKYCAVRVAFPKDNFCFEDWRNFCARLKREMEHDAEILRQAAPAKETDSGASENVFGNRRLARFARKPFTYS